MRVKASFLILYLVTPFNAYRMAGETIISIAYGIDVQPKNDPYVQAAEESVHTLLEAAVPGVFFVDSIPMLKYIPEWVPGATFKRKAREWRWMADRMLNRPFEALKKAMVCHFCYLQRILILSMQEDGTAKPSLGLDGLQLMQTEDSAAFTLDDIKSVTATMYQSE